MAGVGPRPDKARIHRRTKSRDPDNRVDGGYKRGDVEGNWFMCRYEPERQSETRDRHGVRYVRPARIVASKRDLTGAAIDLKAADRVEIVSKRYGTIHMEIDGDPDPVVKKRARLGFTINLRQIARQGASS